jgi:maltooligosyltrehalose trehalohydrolase
MSPGRLKVAAALVLTSPFLPMLFQGEEWGASTPFLYFSDHRDPALAAKVREGRKRAFPDFAGRADEIPDPQAAETFARSKLVWDELSQPAAAELLDWHQRLIHLRRSNPGLCDGRMQEVSVRFDEGEHWIIVERGPWSIACNVSSAPRTLPLREGAHELILSSCAGVLATPPGVMLPPDSAAIFKRPTPA